MLKFHRKVLYSVDMPTVTKGLLRTVVNGKYVIYDVGGITMSTYCSS
jgi:hypothetical protein